MPGVEEMPQHTEELHAAAERIARLNAGERACLELVAEGLASKEIARALGVSPHTIDDRLRSASRKLGARNRFQASQIYRSELSSNNQGADRTTSRLRPEDSGIHAPYAARDKDASAGEGDGSDDHERERLRRLVLLGQAKHGGRRLGIGNLVANFFWGTNRLSAGQRVGIILLIALGFVIGVGTVVNGLTALSRIVGP